MKNYSPLRYPGGKSKLFPNISNFITYNNLNDYTYVEPFAGGCGVALGLLFENKVGSIVINDYDKSIYAFWYSVLNYCDELCSLIEHTNLSIEEWELQRMIQHSKEKVNDLLILGFSTLYLNRTNRSGIIKAGVIGGKNQTGNYKMDCRFNKSDIINRIRLVNKERKRIQLYNLDAIELIKLLSNNNTDYFVYYDPPYYEKGQSLYVNFYDHSNHLELSEYVKKSAIKTWIVSYDNVTQIQKMYNPYRSIEYELAYTAQRKYTGKEIMFFSDTFKQESIDNFFCITELK